MNRPFQRQFQTLRVSLSRRCNLACAYCVAPGVNLRGGPELPPEALAQLVVRLVPHGIKQIKITGGEPLLGERIDRFLPLVVGLGPEVSVTTNGQTLLEKLPLLQRFGVKRINLSLDSLDPAIFRKLTVGGDLSLSLAGLDQALAMGFLVKLNMVPMRGINAQGSADMLEFALSKGVELRFIELMPMGHLSGPSEFSKRFFGLEAILAQLRERFEFAEAERPWGRTAIQYRLAKGQFGIIANHSRPFCIDCDRLRLDAEGKLVGCLSSSESFPLADWLNKPEASLGPVLAQAMATKEPLAFVGSGRGMKSIGG